MALTFIQSVLLSQSQTVTFGSPNTAGNCIVVLIAAFNTGGGGSSPTVTDTQGNTYVPVGGAQIGAPGNWSVVFVAKNIIGGASNTVSYNTFGFGTLRDLAAMEYSGAGINSPILASVSTFVGVAGTISVNLLTRTGDLVLLFTVECGGPSLTTPPAGFTLRNSVGAIPIAIYDGPPTSAGTNPYAIATTYGGGGTLWCIALDNPTTPRSYIFEM